ncbi:MAG: RNA polymerase sigma factor [Acidobacteria bacterium]|nr:MAG: RNA polymerase sigma factor [Acidobacteriota bacterium]
MDAGVELKVKDAALTDDEVVRRVLDGDIGLFEIIMRRYNQRLFRVARSVVKDDSEAEDIIQEAYVRAYEHLSQFEGRAKFSTWLTKIAIYEAYARVRRFDYRNVDSVSNLEDQGMDLKSKEHDPEQQTFDYEMRMLLERALDAIPDDYRSIFMLREIEGLSTAETAECLEISEENVKTRLHRARALLQREFYSAAGTTATTAFQFLGARCDRLVARVMDRIRENDTTIEDTREEA